MREYANIYHLILSISQGRRYRGGKRDDISPTSWQNSQKQNKNICSRTKMIKKNCLFITLYFQIADAQTPTFRFTPTPLYILFITYLCHRMKIMFQQKRKKVNKNHINKIFIQSSRPLSFITFEQISKRTRQNYSSCPSLTSLLISSQFM